MKKICPVCKKEFEPNSYNHQAQKYCNVNCQAKDWRDKNKEKVKEIQKKYKRNNPDKIKLKLRKASLKRNYGITIEEYNKMLNEQNGVCAICGKTKSETLAVDHNHTTMEIRGLLCSHCNHVVGFAKDNIDILEKTINYLKSIDK